MPIAAIWGYTLIVWIAGMPPIADPNFGPKEGARCEMVLADFTAAHPDYQGQCYENWKPEKARKTAVRSASRKHTARR